MKDYNLSDKKYTKDIVILAEKMLLEIERLKTDRITDFILCKYLDFISKTIKKILSIVERNPRFEWSKIQDEIDCYFKKDNSLTGAIIYMDWSETKPAKRVHIKGIINKKGNNGIS